MIDAACGYKVEFSRKYARVIVYEDAKGIIEFTFDLDLRRDIGLFLEGRIEAGALPEIQARRNAAFQHCADFLKARGYVVTDYTAVTMSKNKIKKAVILAAGKGTRMGELTAALPKPMVQVEGKPVLEHIIEGLRDAAGITELFIVTGWCGNVIRDYFRDGSQWNVAINYGEQTVQDGTGRAADPAKDWVGKSDFLLTYGDILIRPPGDYARLVEAFLETGVIAVKDGEDLTKGGAVVLDKDSFMINLVEKGAGTPPPNSFYNAGIYLLPALVFQYTAKLEKSPRGEYEFTDVLKALVTGGARLRGVTLTSGWADVRDPGVLAELNKKPEGQPPA